MKILCKICNAVLTHELKLYDGKSFGEADEQPYIQPGFYTISDGNYFTGTNDCIVINISDLTNCTDHTLTRRLNGCCGLDGQDGPNKICINGHEVATEYSDCWMANATVFEKDKITTK